MKELNMEPQAVADALMAAVEQRDVDRLVRLYAADAVQHHPLAPEPIRGRDALGESERALLAAFPDVTLKRQRVLSADSTAIVELVLTATNTGPIALGPGQELPATGRRIEVPSVWVLELDEEGLIAQERDYFDTAGFFRQLGLQE
jgi:steroid delta-isomerase-like uncharacterized protein